MNPILLLTGLLALAYFGSMLVGGRSSRAVGLPSGTEFLLLGVLLGPVFTGIFSRQGLASFEPLVIVALSWLALVSGTHYGYQDGARVAPRPILVGLAAAAITAALAAAPAALVVLLTTELRGRELIAFALAVGMISAETTRHAVRWVVDRYEASGPLTRTIQAVVQADEAVPLLLLGALTALAPQQTEIALPYAPWSGLVATLALGCAVGATCAALFDIEPRTSQRWGILLGTGLLTIGVSERLGLSAMSATFVMGLVATRLSRARGKLQLLFDTTERAIMLPALVLAGAYVTFPSPWPFIPVALVAVGGRLLGKLLTGRWIGVAGSAPIDSYRTIGAGLMPAGALTVSAGLALVLRWPGTSSEWVLALAACYVVLGEAVGPALLRRALRQAGEIAEGSASQTPMIKRSLPPRIAGGRSLRPARGRSLRPGRAASSRPPTRREP